MHALRTIDAHGGGLPLRLIVEGFPSPRGRAMREKLAWVERHADRVRQVLMHEPRGHGDMCGAVLTEPVAPGSHAGVLFMHGSGFAPAFDHGIVALATIAIERGLIVPGGDGRRVLFDTIAGTIRAELTIGDAAAGESRVASVACTMPPSFVVRGGLPVRVGGRVVPVDVAFGGACYAVVDSEAAGVGLTSQHVPAIRQIGRSILAAVDSALRFVHPLDSALQGVHGVVFTGPATGAADLRAVLMFGDGQIAASPTEAGTAAIVAILDAIGLLASGGRIAVDSLTGAVWSGRVGARTAVGDLDAIIPEIEGTAWLTGDHAFVVRPDDPLSEGFQL